MSFRVTRPPVPEPGTSAIFTSCSAARRRTTGEERVRRSVSASCTSPRPLPPLRGARATGPSSSATGWATVSEVGNSSERTTCFSGGASVAGGAAASATRTISVPTSTVVPSGTRNFSILPATGEGSSAFTLSVSTSARGSSISTSSPSAFSQRVMVPSVTLSPSCGIVTGLATGSSCLLRFDRPGGHERGHVGGDRVVAVAVFVEAGDHEARFDLAPDLLLQGVAELERLSPLHLPPQLFFGPARSIGIRQAIPDPDLARIVGELEVEDVDNRVEETGEQGATLAQHAKGLVPDGPDLGHEQVGDGVEDEVEALVGEGAEIPHIALDGLNVQRLPLGNEPVLRQLSGRVVEHGDVGPRGGERRGLLASSRGEAENVGARHLGEPRPRNVLLVC